MHGKIKITEAMMFEVVILIFLGILLASSFHLPARTKRLPLLIGTVTVLLTVGDLVRSVLSQVRQGKPAIESKKPLERPALLKTLGSVGFMLATVILWWLVGFIITSLVISITFPLFMGAKQKLALVIASIVLTVALYYVFGIFLDVPLPPGILFK